MSLETSTYFNNEPSIAKLGPPKHTVCGCPPAMSMVKLPTNTSICWYPMRVPYGRELKLKVILDMNGVESFIPMVRQQVTAERSTKAVCKYVPAIRNLIFIRSDRAVIDRIKSEVEYATPMRFIMDQSTRQPIIVPEKQMEDFLKVSSCPDRELLYLKETDFSLKNGEQVMITDGPFAGVEGKVLRIKGNKRVVVSIEGVAAVAIAFVPKSHIDKIG